MSPNPKPKTPVSLTMSLPNTPSKGSDVLLLRSKRNRPLPMTRSRSPSPSTSPEIIAAAERAAKAGISVVTVGFGTEQGSTIPIRDGNRMVEKRDENNQIVVTKYNPQTLRAAASAAQGTFIEANATDKATRIRRALQTLRATARQVEGGRNLTPRFQWFLLPELRQEQLRLLRQLSRIIHGISGISQKQRATHLEDQALTTLLVLQKKWCNVLRL